MRVQTVETTGRAAQTMQLMRHMVERYHGDMAPWASLSLPDIYEKVKNLPFRPDPPGRETLMRPRYTMQGIGWGGDCDDKSIALAAWARLRSMPYRFVAVRKHGKKTLHHVFPELYINGRWVAVDPTYSFNNIGDRRHYVERVYG